MPSGMTDKPSPGSRLPSWASLLVLLGAFLAFLAGWAAILGVAYRLDPGMVAHLQDVPQRVLDVYTVGLYLGLLFLMALYWTRFEGRRWSETGLGWAPRHAWEGVSLGAGGLVAIYGVSIALGWAHFVPPGRWPVGTIAADLGAALAMGLAEELLFRGILLRTLLRDSRPAVAILVTAVLYALAHFARPGLTLADSVLPFLGLTATGALFAYAAWSRGSLWVSTGIHAVWIFFIALSSQLNLWAYSAVGYAWTGNGYPPKGLLAAITMLGCVGLLLVKNKQDFGKSLHN